MNEFTSSVSPKGQITIPKQIRQMLGVKPKDRVTVTVENGAVRIRRTRATLDSIYRSIPALKQRRSDKEVVAIAVEEHLRHVAREGRGE